MKDDREVGTVGKDNYNPTASLQLQNAAIFLRSWCKDFFKMTYGMRPKDRKKADKLYADTVAWLKVNKLQGDLK